MHGFRLDEIDRLTLDQLELFATNVARNEAKKLASLVSAVYVASRAESKDVKKYIKELEQA